MAMDTDLWAWLVTVLGAFTCVTASGGLAVSGIASPPVARKLLHTGTGLVYMLCWPLYSGQLYARWLCASVPAAASLHYLCVGLGVLPSQLTVMGSTRTGDRTELLKGPLTYGIVHVVATLLFWRSSPVGCTTIATLCAGDGLADLIGRQLGRGLSLPWNPQKSWPGSCAFLIAAALASEFFLGYLGPEMEHTYTRHWGLLLVSMIACAVESAPILHYDNLTVGVSAMAAGCLLL